MKHLFCLMILFAVFLSETNAQDFYTHPAWSKDATIYEVNVRQYSKEGNFKGVEAQLPRLKEMGVKILWLMPIYPIGVKERKGSLGSYYAVKDYRAVNPEYGTLADFKEFMKQAHALGFKVILDWVANHSAPDNNLTVEHPDYYTHDSTGKIIPPVPDWTDVADFNYDNKGLWNYQIESMKFWIKEADVDGFRCDVAMMVPNEFWKEVRTQLDKVKPVFMLAEADGPEFHRNGFDMTYGWELHSLMNQIAKGKKDTKDLVDYIHKNDSIYSHGEYRMYFTSNHDENSWNGSEYERMGDAAKVFAVLTFGLPGLPLIYSGQESAEGRRIKFFDKDPIDWKDYPLAGFYKKLVWMKKENPALFNGLDGGNMTIIETGNKNIFCFTRTRGEDKVLFMLNLSGTEQKFNVNGAGINGNYQSLFSDKPITLPAASAGKLAPWGYEVFVQNKR